MIPPVPILLRLWQDVSSLSFVVILRLIITAKSEHAAWLQLAKEAEEEPVDTFSNVCIDNRSDIHPSLMIFMGLQLEDDQYVVCNFKVLVTHQH